ncbi:DUF2628 domain-containing protein [Variovorax sp. J22G73]|uniref:DUF2628 domain-containing protein n=1 Tax=unclassified Variovorax TaxID=663243 RepID=UPI002578952C|nr:MULTISPECIES: DUF2628 domain-containing protein [unclassified Variovorax]MDM0009306.1 DUF2628 domain-containing protein [Variovorax sp. J22R203]MDM0101758.1 DUF2628 domain-containing protein [Variovorax sp. J22G73]
MKIYKVFEHPSGHREAIREGWSWTAFLFGWIWALCHGVWPLALGVLAFGMLIGFGAPGLGASNATTLVIASLFGIVNSIVLGSIGNSLRASWQVGKGYACVDVVQAANAQEALWMRVESPEPEATQATQATQATEATKAAQAGTLAG